jgi:glucokinase
MTASPESALIVKTYGNQDAAHDTIIGIDVGGTKTTVVEGTRDGHILARSEHATEGARRFADSWPSLAARVAATIAQAEQSGRRPGAISVAVGGPLLASEGRLIDPPNLPGWHNVALADRLRERFPGRAVHIEHDAKAGALAEFRFGVGATRPRLTDMVFLTFGTGLGAGIITGGRLVRGEHEMAGEVWDLALTTPGGARVSEIDGWEDAASGRGIAELAARLHPPRWPRGTPTREIVGAAVADDAEALDVVSECGRWLGAGIAVLVMVLDPQLVVLGTLAVVLGERVLAPARAEVARALGSRRTDCEILPSGLGSRLGDVQSLMAAIEAEAAGA